MKLNGKDVKGKWSHDRGNHGTVELQLEKGWNLWTGEVEILTENWAHLIGHEKESEISLHVTKNLEEKNPIAISPVSNRSELTFPSLEFDALPFD